MNKLVIIGSLGILIAGGAAIYTLQPKRAASNKDAGKTPQAIPAEAPAKKPAASDVSSSFKIPGPPPVESEKAIQEIRQEIQAVMDLNKKISTLQTARSAQMLRIQEQAVVHQKILADIQQISENKNSQIPTREALLAQEKLRIIREETLRNKKALETRRTLAQKAA